MALTATTQKPEILFPDHACRSQKAGDDFCGNGVIARDDHGATEPSRSYIRWLEACRVNAYPTTRKTHSSTRHGTGAIRGIVLLPAASAG